jgi:hypothetical protein
MLADPGVKPIRTTPDTTEWAWSVAEAAVPLDCYDQPDASRTPPQPHIGVLFECCGVYARIYRRPGERVYQGRCPKCLRMVRVRVGPDGTNVRLFRAH